jgi:membrane-associated protein
MLDAIKHGFDILTEPQALLALLTSVFAGIWAYLFLFFVIFAETGLLIGFFLPGDSLMFTVGVVAGAGGLNIWLISLVLIVAAILGDSTGYFLGRSLGKRAFNREDSLIFRREYVDMTRDFYREHGGKTIIYARFIPIIRTFAPFIAGVGEMDYRHFIVYNIFGGIAWVLLMTLLGYGLGNIAFVRDNFDKAILLIIAVSLIPPIMETYRRRKAK